jgi:glycosyltransferase involved in cell wall biosynthesis
MRAVILSTYPPRRCGIASFTADLRESILEADTTVDVGVIAVVDGAEGEVTPRVAAGDRPPQAPSGSAPEVVRRLRQHRLEDYSRTASWVNRTRPDVVLVEHEFGIFGGEDGRHLLELTRRLTVPYVVTLHTVRSQPSPGQLQVLRSLCGGAAQVTVFSTTGRNLLLAQQIVDADRITVVVHGAPEFLRPGPGPRKAGESPRPAIGIPELREVAATPLLARFGLLSPGKGIETAVRALPQIVERLPGASYVVAGRTHPEVARRDGESYRESLQLLADDLGVADNIVFIDRFLDTGEVRELLTATSVFVTPYRSYEQIVSGVLTYAVVAGCPVVSTPYLYAVDMLRDGAGRLFPFGDHECLARHVTTLLEDEGTYADAVGSAHRKGAQHTWPEVGRHLLKVLADASTVHETVRDPVRTSRAAPLPLAQLARLTDDVGIVQHARSTQPDHASGYCVDDVARLGIVAIGLLRTDPHNPWFAELVRTSVRFLSAATDPSTATMHNLAGFDGTWQDRPHTGDHVGRAIWALGEMVAADEQDVLAGAPELLEILAAAPVANHARSVAFSLLGWSRKYERDRDPTTGAAVDQLVDTLMAQLDANADEGWYWFEDVLTYDNARLPQSLLAASRARPNQDARTAALRALDWYCEQCHVDGPAVTLVGNRWRARPTGAGAAAPIGRPGEEIDEGDEQPLDAAALVEACVEAYRTTGEAIYRQRALRALDWFHGRNRWGLALVDPEPQGCHDGVGPNGVNANQGAESTLAYLQARLAVAAAGIDLRHGAGQPRTG